MPPIFKALATISAWTLFICGWLMLLGTTIGMGVRGDLFSTEVLKIGDAIAFALAGVGIVLAVVVMILRKKME
jgi:uncharacterized membrane protein